MGELKGVCLSCGICCEGVTVGFVLLDKDELPVQKKMVDVEEEGGQGLFFLPCKNQTSAGCKIYMQRSKRCRLFKCGVLTAVEDGELDYDFAIEIIEETIQRTTAIKKQFVTLPFQLKSTSFYFQVFELKKLLREDHSEFSSSEEIRNLLSEIKALDELLAKYFGVSF